MAIINVKVEKKIAKANKGAFIVCGNSDYTLHFSFDEEWQGENLKTARFVYNGTYTDIVFEGDTCPVPVLKDTSLVAVGVFAGDLKTTTPALIACRKCITDENGMPADPAEDVYNQIIELCGVAVDTARSVEERANAGEFKGDKGDKGDPPVKGVDYWTKADKKEITDYVDKVTKSLEGQNEYIGSYNGTNYTADTIQSILSAFVQAIEGRNQRGGDIVNIVNAGAGVDYSGQQWIYSAGDTAGWKYYIDFENHSVVDNLESDSAVDGLSARQGKALNEKFAEYVKFTDIANDNKAGVLRAVSTFGFTVDAYGRGQTVKATNADIDAKTSNYKPIVPATQDHAWKVSATTNTETWTDEDKAKACETIGAVAKQNPEFDSGATRGYVYFIDPNGNQIVKKVQVQANYDTIPLRNANGNFYVGTPTLAYECTPKGYVDGLIAELVARIEALEGK